MISDWQPIQEEAPPRALLMVYIQGAEYPFVYTVSEALASLISQFPAATHWAVVIMAPEPLIDAEALAMAERLAAMPDNVETQVVAE